MSGRKTGPRILLKYLRDAMAEPIGPQERLDRIVQQIAEAMAADVCSVYVLRADDLLELFATYGLNREAVHRSQLRIGQGIVGTVATMGRPFNLADAQSHPSFAYLPETGEDAYHGFLGVPMKRAGRSLGVLVVQRREKRRYDPEEVEALETAAMVLSDLVASGELKGLANQGVDLDLSRPVSQEGVRLSPGIAIGKVVLHEPRVVVENLFNKDEDAEMRRLATAIQAFRRTVDALVDRSDIAGEGDHTDVLETYRMFAHDRGWVRRIEQAIRDGLTAEAAVQKVAQENRARLMRSADPYMRERVNDFDDLARRLMRELVGAPHIPVEEGAMGEYVLVARTMSAAELLDYDPSIIKGLVLEEATATSHVVIVARALGIAVVQSDGFVARAEGSDAIIVDGDEGSVHLRPQEDLEGSYRERQEFRARRVARFDALRDQRAVTRDGVEIDLLLNAGLSMDLPQLDLSGAAGIGLFRTELQFMLASRLPKLDEQVAFYRSVLDAAGNRPVTFRTLDVGGDKVLPYLRTIKEDNPALGWRAIRLSIDRPGLLRRQLKALLKAAEGKVLRIKLPMVTMVQEIDHVRAMLDHEIEQLAHFGHALPEKVLLGSMIEVPSLLWQLDELMDRADFVSVGSNDLFQFFVASDRTNSYLANRYNPLSRPFLRALRQIAEVARRRETPFHLCGELAGDPLSALTLIGLGYRGISMPPGSIGPIKEMVRMIDLGEVSEAVHAILDDTSGTQTFKEAMRDFADHKGIPL